MQSVYQDKNGDLREDEDFPLFLEELRTLLNQYHYGFKGCHFVKFVDENVKVIDYFSDGKDIEVIITDSDDERPKLLP